MGRALKWHLLAALVVAGQAGCTDSESETAIVVDFTITGEGAAQARWLDVLVRCDPEDGRARRLDPFDLERTSDQELSLAIEASGLEACDLYVGAQVFDEARRYPIAVDDRTLAFEQGAVRLVTLQLDTSTCANLDKDGGTGGAGGEHGCGGVPDCDELDGSVHGEAVEVCNGRDDDCDGEVDGGDIDALGWALSCDPEGERRWSPEEGLCRFVTPRCVEGVPFCPGLGELDVGEPPLDANCDGVIEGCDCRAIVDDYQCAPCHEATCADSSTLVCEPVQSYERLGEPCDAGGCGGVYQCDPSTNAVACQASSGGVEVCNDLEGLDEDCDGQANEADDQCSLFTGGDLECPAIELPSYGAPGTEEHGMGERCVDGVTQVFPLFCEDLPAGEIDMDVMPFMRDRLYIALDLPPSINLEVLDIEGCCECSGRFSHVVEELGYPAIVIEGFQGELMMTDEASLLRIIVDAWVNDDSGTLVAEYRELEVSLPVISGGLSICISPCAGSSSILLPEDRQDYGGGGN